MHVTSRACDRTWTSATWPFIPHPNHKERKKKRKRIFIVSSLFPYLLSQTALVWWVRSLSCDSNQSWVFRSVQKRWTLSDCSMFRRLFVLLTFFGTNLYYNLHNKTTLNILLRAYDLGEHFKCVPENVINKPSIKFLSQNLHKIVMKATWPSMWEAGPPSSSSASFSLFALTREPRSLLTCCNCLISEEPLSVEVRVNSRELWESERRGSEAPGCLIQTSRQRGGDRLEISELLHWCILIARCQERKSCYFKLKDTAEQNMSKGTRRMYPRLLFNPCPSQQILQDASLPYRDVSQVTQALFSSWCCSDLCWKPVCHKACYLPVKQGSC